MPRTQCISVIDEADTFTQAAFDADWATFKSDYPDRQFWLLTPRPAYTNELRIPAAFLSDPLANGNINVNRDGGNVAARSDWFAICNLDTLPEGSVISVAIDTSGSMTLGTVQASYDYFQQRCADAGLVIVFDLTFPNERWIVPHLKDIPPSASFYVLVDGVKQTTAEIVVGESITLYWIIFGDVNSADITPTVGDIAPENYESSFSVSPVEDTSYLLRAEGDAGVTSRTINIIVLVPPEIILSADPITIVAGTCTTISWYTTGDADSLEWLSGNITNLNLTSNEVVCPLDTTTYTAKVDGRAGDFTGSITIVVYQIPVINSFTVPSSLTYGSQGTIEYDCSYANINIELLTYFDYENGDGFILDSVVELTPIADSAEIGVGTTTVTGTVNTNISYNDFGPRRVQFVLRITGSGGVATLNAFTDIIIDETPDNFIIPETDDKFKDEDPVYTPETEILSELLLVDGIDIPVEIKSNYPIQVDINQADDWKSIRQL